MTGGLFFMILSSFSTLLEEFSKLTPIHKTMALATQALLLASLWQSYKVLIQLNKHTKLSSNKKSSKAFLSGPFFRKHVINRFLIQAKAITHSLSESLTQEYFLPAEAYAALPVLQQLREKGEALSSDRKRFALGSLPSVQSEIDLRMVISELRSLEARIRRLPRAKMSLTEVLAGRFNEDYISNEVARSEVQ
jgi:hypothetical protein